MEGKPPRNSASFPSAARPRIAFIGTGGEDQQALAVHSGRRDRLRQVAVEVGRFQVGVEGLQSGVEFFLLDLPIVIAQEEIGCRLGKKGDVLVAHMAGFVSVGVFADG